LSSTVQNPELGILARLWTGILAGPLGWAMDEVVGYSATAHECSTGSIKLLHGLTVAALAICLVGLISANSVRGYTRDSSTARDERTRTMAISGMVLSVAFALLVVATAIPRWILSPCN